MNLFFYIITIATLQNKSKSEFFKAEPSYNSTAMKLPQYCTTIRFPGLIDDAWDVWIELFNDNLPPAQWPLPRGNWGSNSYGHFICGKGVCWVLILVVEKVPEGSPSCNLGNSERVDGWFNGCSNQPPPEGREKVPLAPRKVLIAQDWEGDPPGVVVVRRKTLRYKLKKRGLLRISMATME